jgi:hypothetical protein
LPLTRNCRNRHPWPAFIPVADQQFNFVPSPTALRLKARQIRALARALVHPEAGIVLSGYAIELDARADKLEAAEQRVAGADGAPPAAV